MPFLVLLYLPSRPFAKNKKSSVACWGLHAFWPTACWYCELFLACSFHFCPNSDPLSLRALLLIIRLCYTFVFRFPLGPNINEYSNPSNPIVFFDIGFLLPHPPSPNPCHLLSTSLPSSPHPLYLTITIDIGGKDVGRIEMELFANVCPKTVEPTHRNLLRSHSCHHANTKYEYPCYRPKISAFLRLGSWETKMVRGPSPSHFVINVCWSLFQIMCGLSSLVSVAMQL
jgi:hypothetical protein